MTDRVPAALLDKVQTHEVILFVGAGVSMTAGLASWTKIAHDLVTEAVRLGIIDENYAADLQVLSPLDIGSIAGGQLRPLEFGTFLLQKFNSIAQSTVHHHFRRIGFDRIITTNWDTMLEEMNRDNISAHDPLMPWQNTYTGSFCHTDHFLIEQVRQGRLRRWIFHLHGVYYRPETIVWSEVSYRNVMTSPPLQSFIQNVLHDSTILYVGCSLEDRHFILLQDHLNNTFGGLGPTQYAFIPGATKPLRDKLRMSYNIIALSYDVDHSLPQQLQHVPGLVALLDQIVVVKPPRVERNLVKGRASWEIEVALEQALSLLPTDGARPIIQVYASAGRDFLTDHRRKLIEFLVHGGAVQLLLMHPEIMVKLPTMSDTMSLLEWRGQLELDGATMASNHTCDEQIEAVALVDEINREASTRNETASQILVKACVAFPINTICRIGDVAFDCPRPVGQRSFQSPMRQYRSGSYGFQFITEQFERLWSDFAVLWVRASR